MKLDEKKLLLALQIHNELSQLIKPATPVSIATSSLHAGKFLFLAFLGVLSGFGLMLFHAMFGAYFLISENLSILGAAFLGASFYSLYTATKYFKNGTFDPKYFQIYFIRFLLGVLAGVLFGVFGDQLIHLSTTLNQQGNPQASTHIPIARTLLALIGGYSSEVVAQILKRISDTLLTLVRGNQKEEHQINAEMDNKKNQLTVGAQLQAVLNLPEDQREDAIKKMISKITK